MCLSLSQSRIQGYLSTCLLFPVDRTSMRCPRAPHLAQLTLEAEPRDWRVRRVARHVDQRLVTAGVVKAERYQVINTLRSHIRKVHRRAGWVIGLGGHIVSSGRANSGAPCRRKFFTRVVLPFNTRKRLDRAERFSLLNDVVGPGVSDADDLRRAWRDRATASPPARIGASSQDQATVWRARHILWPGCDIVRNV